MVVAFLNLGITEILIFLGVALLLGLGSAAVWSMFKPR
jgi:hypothetical protein